MTDQPAEQLAIAPQPQDAPLVYGEDDSALVRIYNKELDAYGEAPRAGVQYLNGWEIVDPTPAEAAAVTSYDPSAHGYQEVIDYLEAASEAEREAVLALERDGKNRTTIVDRTYGSDDPS